MTKTQAIVLSLVVGHGVGAIAVTLGGPPPSSVVPPWVFPAVWTALFPCFALATLRALDGAPRPEVRAAKAWALAAALVTLAWLPVACVADEPWVNVGLDVGAWLVLAVAGWVFARASRAALCWLAPLLVWMPITTAISVVEAGGWLS